nr:hypothetical protein [Mucilaginibacter sp. X5P1]
MVITLFFNKAKNLFMGGGDMRQSGAANPRRMKLPGQAFRNRHDYLQSFA